MDNEKIKDDWISETTRQLLEEGFDPSIHKLNLDYSQDGKVVITWEDRHDEEY